MKKRISPKTIFLIIQCLLMIIAPFLSYWTVFKRVETPKFNGMTPVDSNHYYVQSDNRFKLFGSNGVLNESYRASTYSKYSYVDSLRIFSSVLVVIITLLAVARLVLYVMEILNFRFHGRFTYPKKLEKYFCMAITLLIVLLVVIVVFFELKGTIGIGGTTVGSEESSSGTVTYYDVSYNLFASIGFYLTVIPGVFLGMMGKEPKPQKD